ncbi:transcription-repair coupling factor [Planctomyces sp. SH-PL14]|uniref:transcription-repair coupling factor n=1 Tax=Planctomyces sp. SH-PL14 TaxID=1632864 RepID=UPI00078D165D|nr:transcription-repair coupling factor [Planctomyces sp. SH-PL14]AMV19893.1 Transcription-repair-coupling factor [Planctomyces sp. SH-PL14]
MNDRGGGQTIRALPDLIARIRHFDEFRHVLGALQHGESGTIDGAWGSSSALTSATLASEVPGTLVVVLPRLSEVDDFAADLAPYLPEPPRVFPAWETLPKERSVSDQVFGARLRVLQELESPTPPKVVVTCFPALMQPVPSRESRQAGTRTLQVGKDLEVDEFLLWLVQQGFERVPSIEAPGEFAVHGGIIDIFPPDATDPLRVELFGDEIDSIRRFDVETQRKVEDLKQVALTAIGPKSEETKGEPASTKKAPKAQDPAPVPSAYFFDSLPKGSWLVLSELQDLVDEGKHYLERLENPQGLFSVQATLARTTERPTVTVSALAGDSAETTCHLKVESIERFTGPRAEVLNELATIVGRDETVLIACHNQGERDRLGELLKESVPELAPRVTLCLGTVTRGFRLVRDRILVLSDNELFNRVEVRRTTRTRKRAEGRAIDSFLDLKVGDLIVHLAHGIGRFRGMELLEKEGAKEEHLSLEFRDGVMIYVPVSLIHLVQKYVGASKGSPPLSKIGGTAWAGNKSRVAQAVQDMASDMLKLQAQRAHKPGYACPPDSHLQQEFDAAFPYVPTDDQVRAIDDSKIDLMRDRPMDRLICGDVGFGKTEVAMRAVFKMVDAGKQVAVLVPTTVLAEQHYRSFSDRMAEFPVRVDVLSRFRSTKETKELLLKMEEGQVDVVIGTHRMVQKDVKFKDLGLLVIDEEQRFGVDAKEMLKRVRLSVDVLTLSATPIPRTLHMSLLGIRDISNLTTPPQDRMAIETRIVRWDADLIKQAIVREMNRGGQVFFVHNKVWDIKFVAERLQAIVPDARIAIVHGQMNENELERNMLDFVRHRADILLATTIIESGVDIPNANTMFIDQAENYGLADLHQLRGRVGRYKHRAYCYLLLDENKSLTSIAARRLKAIEEFSELGAGFKISMRDLEIRGAGNILGTEQSGHISTVGYELYCQLLENAVRSLKGMPAREHPHVDVELAVTAFLPNSYVPAGRPKIDLYRKISAVATLEELGELANEMRDRFGPIPAEAQQLLLVRELQLHAWRWSIRRIYTEEGRFAVFEYKDDKTIKQLQKKLGSDLRIVDARKAYLLLPKRDLGAHDIVDHLKSLLPG